MSPIEQAGLVENQTYLVSGKLMVYLGSRWDPCWGVINVWRRPDASGQWHQYECRAGRLWVEETLA